MREVTIQFIGSGDAFASSGKFNTCFHVSTSDSNFLIDCGASSLIGLKKAGVNLREIDTIFISHFHGDHFGGLPFFILDAQLVQKRSEPLTIVGPIGLKDKVNTLREAMFPASTSVALNYDLRIVELDDLNKQEVNGKKVTYYPVIHSPESNPHGLRVEVNDKVIAYSGDTEWTESLIELGKEADLFIIECYNYQGHLKFHMSYETLLGNLSKISTKKVMLTHLGDDMLEQVDSLELDVCEDGMSLTV